MSQTKAQLVGGVGFSTADSLTVHNGLAVTGVVTATSFAGNITGNADTATFATTAGIATNAQHLSGTPGIEVGIITASSISAVSADFSGNVTIGGTLQYEDVTNIDAIGIVTARSGINITGAGMTVTGIGTFRDSVNLLSGATVTGVVTATSFVGDITGDVTGTASNASGATGDFSIADKIVHTGDTNTAIRFPSTDTITFETSGSEALRVDSSGRLLLGTSTASSAGNSQYSKIEVSGNTSTSTGPGQLSIKRGEAASLMSDNDTVGRLIFASNTGGDFAYIQSNVDGTPSGSSTPGDLSFYTTSSGFTPTERVRILSNGHVVIGDTSDTGFFRVSAADGASDDQYVGQFENLEATAGRSYGVNIRAGSNSTDHGLRVRNRANDTTQFLVRGDGNVGINESSPDSTLHVTGPSSGTILTLDRAGSYSWKLGQSSGSDLTFTGDTSERLRIGSSGQLGLGGANYGTSGQVITSNGSGSAPTWQDAAGGGTADFTASGAISNGDTVIINSNGTVSSVSGTVTSTPSVGNVSAGFCPDIQRYTASYDPINQKVVVVYQDTSISANTNYFIVLGTVIGENIKFGNPVVFETGSNNQQPSMCYDPDSESHLIVTSGNYSRITVVKVEGDSLTIGRDSNGFTPSSGSTGDVQDTAISYDTSANKAVLFYGGYWSGSFKMASRVVTVSGTSVSYGSETQMAANGSSQFQQMTAVYDDANNRTVLVHFNSSGGRADAYVGTVSGTSISFGSSVEISGNIDNLTLGAAYDTSANRVVVCYCDNGNSDRGTVRVGTVSGTSISFGTAVVFNSNNTERTAITYEPVNNKIIVSYANGTSNNDFNMKSGTVSGSTISFGSAVQYSTDNVRRPFGVSDSNLGKGVFITFSTENSSAPPTAGGTAYVFSQTTISTNLTDQNYIGIAAEAISNGASGKINIAGGINEGQSSLTVGRKHYVQPNGDISTVINYPSVFAGTSISATKIVVKG